MKSAFDINHAGQTAGVFARRAVRVALACALVLGGSTAAFGQQYGQYGSYGERQYGGERRDDPAMQQGGRGRFQLPQDRDAREAEARAYEEQQRRQQYQQDQRDNRRNSGRMTADERRDLRRQIKEGGADLYPPRR